jgi:hypothetical protein
MKYHSFHINSCIWLGKADCHYRVQPGGSNQYVTEKGRLVQVVLLALGIFLFIAGPSQNIPVADGVNWIGANNGYQQPINGSAATNVLKYRKVSTTGTPVDGRGQWWTTLNAQASAADVLNQNLTGGSGNGFLFTSGGGAGNLGTSVNNWGQALPGQVSVNSITPLVWNGFSANNEIGLDMSQPGYYTFVMQDSGIGYKNSRFYNGYTSNEPVSFSHNGATQRYVLSDRSALLIATLAGVKSPEEKLYIRYKTTLNDFSTGASTISAEAQIRNDIAIVVLPPQVAGQNVYYYFFSSTLSQTQLQALSESDKSLACLRVQDNSGLNYTYAIPAIATLYQHNFNTAPTAGIAYTIAPNVLNANLNTSNWFCPGFFSNAPAQRVGNTGSSLSPASGISGTPITLNINIASGYSVSLTSLSFWRSSNVQFNTISSITINGTTIASNIGIPRNANAGAGSNTVNISDANNLTGQITIVINLQDGGNGGTVFLDDFVLQGNIALLPSFLGFRWVGGVSSSWRTAGNWSPSGVPGAGSNVVVDATSANPLVVNAAQSVNNISIEGMGVIQVSAGGSLEILGNMMISSAATVMLDCGSTVIFASSAFQFVPALQYGNLDISGGPRQFESGSTTFICGNYKANSNGDVLNTTGVVINFNGTNVQSINTNATTFTSLIISNNLASVSSNVPIAILPGGSLSIDANARLDMGVNTLSLTGAIAMVNGSLRSAGLIDGADASTLIINDGGIFEYSAPCAGQASLGTLPLAQWNSGSTCAIIGLTTPQNGSWFNAGDGQMFFNFTWNTPSLSTRPRLGSIPLNVSGTLSVVSTGTGSWALGDAVGGVVNCTNFSQTGGTIDFSTGVGVTVMNCQGSFTRTNGKLINSGTSLDQAIFFTGSGVQALTGSLSATSEVNYIFDNPNGFNLTGSTHVYGRVILRKGGFSGNGGFYYGFVGGLIYDCSNSVVTGKEWPLADEPYFVRINNGITVELNGYKAIGELRLNSGILKLGNYNLTIETTGDVIGEQAFSSTNMVMVNGTGKLGLYVPVNGFPRTLLYPIGNTEYSPVNFNFSSNSIGRVVYLGLVEATHPNVSGIDYLSNRYWSTDLDVVGGSYSYTVNYPIQSGWIQGNSSNIRLSRWNGLTWSNVPTSSISGSDLVSGAANETTAPLYGPAEWSGRAATANKTYFWKYPVTGSWIDATNWTPMGVPISGDEVVFNQPSNTTVTNVPGGTFLTSISFSGGGNVVLQGGANGLLTANGQVSPQLSVDALSTLTLAGTTFSLGLNVGPGSIGQIFGKVILKEGTNFISADDSAGLRFESGSKLEAGVLNGTSYNGYAAGITGTKFAVLFKSGSAFEQFDGLDPFGQLTPVQFNKLKFEPGSLYIYSNNNNVANKLPFLSGRTYEEYQYNSTQILAPTGFLSFSVGNFTVKQGGLDIKLESAGNSFRGNIILEPGTSLNINPNTGAAYAFNGARIQSISGAGTIAFGQNSICTITSGTTLLIQKDITLNGTWQNAGILNLGPFLLSSGSNGRYYSLDGSLTICGDIGGLAFSGATGNIRTSFRSYSSFASYEFNNPNGNTGDFLAQTVPLGNHIASLFINSSGTIVLSSAGSPTIKKLSLASGSFSIGNKFIYIPSDGEVRSAGGRMAPGTSGGTVSFAGNLSPGTPVYGNPQFRNAIANGGVNFVDFATVNNIFQISAGGFVISPPTYAIGSRLIYSTAGIYDRGPEWDQLVPGGPGYPHTVSVQNGTSLNLGTTVPTNLEAGGDLIIGAPNSSGSVSLNALTQPLKILGNIFLGNTFNSNNCKVVLSTSPGGNLELSKSLVRYGTAGNDITSNSRIVYFKGSGNDSISYMITTAPVSYGTQSLSRMVMQKTGTGDITLKVPLTLTDSLNLTSGIINNSVSTMLTVSNTRPESVTGGSSASYVNGILRRFTSNTVAGQYSFPVGKSIAPLSYRPVTISTVISPGTLGGQFTAEYMYAVPPPPSGQFYASVLTGVINNEYWQIDRSGNATNGLVTLPYNTTPGNGWRDVNYNLLAPCAECGVGIVRLNEPSSNWDFTDNAGNLSRFTNPPELRQSSVSGDIISKLVSSFGKFTFGFGYSIILPVQLLSFDGRASGADAQLTWQVASNKDLAAFQLQHSSDGRNFSQVAQIAQGGTSYGYTHQRPGAGVQYYRLIVIGMDGNKTTSRTVALVFGKAPSFITGLVQNPVGAQAVVSLYSASDQKAAVLVVDVNGRIITRLETRVKEGGQNLPVSLPFTAPGTYFLHIRLQDGVSKTIPFLKQ